MNENHKQTVGKLIGMYCKKRHAAKGTLCNDCSELLEYANLRLEKCVFGNNKPECKHCPVHCYKPVMRDKIKVVMRFVGPRLMFYDPAMFVKYISGKVGKSKVVPLPSKKRKEV